MENLIKKFEERKAALIAQSEKSTSVEELRSIQQKILEINSDLAEMKTDERTATVNGAVTFTQGKGFIPAEERAFNDFSKLFETREKAGTDLKEKRAVKSPLGIFGELRAVTVANGVSIVVPKSYSDTINPEFNAVSTLIDDNFFWQTCRRKFLNKCACLCVVLER